MRWHPLSRGRVEPLTPASNHGLRVGNGEHKRGLTLLTCHEDIFALACSPPWLGVPPASKGRSQYRSRPPRKEVTPCARPQRACEGAVSKLHRRGAKAAVDGRPPPHALLAADARQRKARNARRAA